ncbi:MAG: hypothetical protein BA873_07090 [Desulfobulbaceae bacterium C00003063]|nr:MAG: hypothetical protein BA873_07090 [Desulfobulbaceae bacterium C00003063]
MNFRIYRSTAKNCQFLYCYKKYFNWLVTIYAEEEHQATCSNSDDNPQPGRFYVRGLVSLLGGRLKKYWRIGVHWLIAVKNYLLETFNDNIIQNLAGYT